MNRKRKPVLIILILLIILVMAIFIINIVNRYMPSKERVDIHNLFGLEENDDESVLAVIVDDEIAGEKSAIYNDNVYLNLETVKEHINNKFYWDSNENILIFTTPNDIIKTDVGSNDYYINKIKNSFGHTIVKADGDNVYIAAEFVKQYTGISYSLYSEPNRVTVTSKWGTFSVADIKKESVIRTDADIKSPIVYDVKKGDQVTVVGQSGKWSKVSLEGGYIGYIKNKDLSKIREEERTTDFQEPVYTSITRDHKINLTWHQVFNQEANNNLPDLLSDTKGINVVSPTWYALSDTEGGVSSLADKTYVERAHNLGYEVWALVADFSDGDKDGQRVAAVLPYSSKRETLINQLIADAIQYNLEGINIDFEYIKRENGEDFIQFLRELSIKCRNNNIVLSVDNYVPSAWSEYYNREEQGELIDYIVIMAYDEYNNSSDEAGPVASIGFVEDAITNILELVEPSKVIMGIPFYTRVWEESADGLSSSSYGMSAINDLIDNRGLTKTWLSDLGVNYCEYENDGNTYKMWIEDGQSAEGKMRLIKENDLAGVASWKLGLESADIWDVIIKYVN